MVVGTSPGSSFLMPSEDERTERQLEPHPCTLWYRSVGWFVSSDGRGDDLVTCLELKG